MNNLGKMEGVKEKVKRLDKLEEELDEREKKWNAIELVTEQKRDIKASAEVMEMIKKYVDTTPDSLRLSVGMLNQSLTPLF